MGRRSLDKKSRRKWWIIGASAAALLLAVAAVGVAVVMKPQPPLEREGTASPLVKVDPAVTSVNVPAMFDSWSTNPAVGDGVQADASDSGLSARFVVGTATPIMSQNIAVEPNLTYTVAVTYRSDPADQGVAAVTIGTEAPVELKPTVEWTTEEFLYVNPGESHVTLTLQSTGPLDGFRLGEISVRSAADAEAVANSEFDAFAAPARITNSSLFMDTGSAYLGVSAPVSAVVWSVAGTDGVEILSGTSHAQAGLSLIQLSPLKQGFYSVTLSSPEPGLPAGKVSLVVLDEVVPAQVDVRLGTIVHLDRPQSEGSDAVAQALGFGTVRADAWWAGNEVAEGVYAFPAGLDQIYANYRARGIEILPIAAYSNPLYDDNQTPSSPRGLAAYAKYVAAVVDHYDVGAVTIYNEYNHLPFNNSACGTTPACYMEMLVPAADAVRMSHPGTLIIGPENAHKDDEFLTGLYQAGGLNYLDAVSFHPYDYGFEENGSPEFLVESLAQATARIQEFNTDDTPPGIWITELGWTSVLTESEAQQGDYLARAEVLSLTNGADRFFWYNMINDAESPGDNVSNYGLVHQKTESVPTFEPKAAAAAQAIVSRMLAGKEPKGRDDLGADVYSYRFGDGNDAVTVAWAMSPTSVTYEAEAPVRITGATGEQRTEQPVDGNITIQLDTSPVFLSFAASEPSLAK